MTGTTYSQTPSWVYQAGAPAAGLYGWLGARYANRAKICWPSLATIAVDLKVSVATVKRWMTKLKKIGALTVRRARRRDGRLAGNVYTLSWEDPSMSRSEPRLTGEPSRTTPKSNYSSSRSILTAATPQPASLFDDLPDSSLDRLDSRRSNSDNDFSKIKEKDSTRGCGTSTRRVIAYWLRGRSERPSQGVIAGMGRAIKTCCEQGIDERDLKAGIDELMRRGCDIFPSQLLARFGLRKPAKRPKKRDYTTEPLYKHHPKPSSMTVERKVEAGWLPPSSAATSLPSSTPSESTSALRSRPAGPATYTVPDGPERYVNGVMMVPTKQVSGSAFGDGMRDLLAGMRRGQD